MEKIIDKKIIMPRTTEFLITNEIRPESKEKYELKTTPKNMHGELKVETINIGKKECYYKQYKVENLSGGAVTAELVQITNDPNFME